MHSAERSSVTLVEFLQREMDKQKWTPVDLEARSGVSRGALRNILEKTNTVPTLGTLKRLGLLFGLPLWRMVELAGFDAQVNEDTPAGRTARIIQLSKAMPQLSEALDYIADLPAEDLEGVLIYLEALKRRRDQAGLGPGEPAE
jgi:transcriptional regulator with XRE-family HTH domain